MKKILVTGAAGLIGLEVLNNLIKENKYEITALDLKSKEANKKLKKYQNQINIIYGDVEDSVLMDALIKDHDFVIHLAGIIPPLCNLSKSFGNQIDYKGTQNIIRSISILNPKCLLVYISATTIYEKQNQEVTIDSKIKISNEDYFSKTKESCENLVKENLKNYIIFRIPFILGDLKFNKNIYLYQKNEPLELITSSKVAEYIVLSINHYKDFNKKTKILSGGNNYRINSNELMIKIYNTYGISFSLFWNKLFNPYKYHGNIFKEDKKIKNFLKNQNDSIDSYFQNLKEISSKRKINRIMARPLRKKLERSLKK